MDQVDVITNGTLIVGHDGNIVAVGAHDALSKQFPDASFQFDVDAHGKTIVPGLVDAHTHPVWYYQHHTTLHCAAHCPVFSLTVDA